jgi:hypothetical protein
MNTSSTVSTRLIISRIARSRQDVADGFYSSPTRKENILVLVEAQCGWLSEIGFQDIDCFFRMFEHAMFGGPKNLAAPVMNKLRTGNKRTGHGPLRNFIREVEFANMAIASEFFRLAVKTDYGDMSGNSLWMN